MKFLVDAQLPMRLASHLAAAGHDAVHASQLPDGNRTTDDALAARANAEQRVMVTKDRDFEISHRLSGTPRQLLQVSTGNITNSALIDLFDRNLALLERELASSDHVELLSLAIVVRRGTSGDRTPPGSTV